jgi:hypothetical protein
MENFPVADLDGLSRDHAIALFSQKRKIPVMIKEGDSYISNDMELRNLYRHKGNRVYALSDIKKSICSFGSVGFLQ